VLLGEHEMDVGALHVWIMLFFPPMGCANQHMMLTVPKPRTHLIEHSQAV
jgi:hypothetical protein